MHPLVVLKLNARADCYLLTSSNTTDAHGYIFVTGLFPCLYVSFLGSQIHSQSSTVAAVTIAHAHARVPGVNCAFRKRKMNV